MWSYRTTHYLNELVQKTAFKKHNLNKCGATKNFIGDFSIVPSLLTLISSLIDQENELLTRFITIKLI